MKLADRLKSIEKAECSKALDSNLPLMVRIDGRCFSKFTKGLQQPFDMGFCKLMNETTVFLMKETDAKMAYTQSDEITLSFYNDKENYSNSEYMFGGKIQKLTSVLASMATSYFVKHLEINLPACADKYPQFDCRVWNAQEFGDIGYNYVWRYRDCIRNSICMYARSFFSHKQLNKKSTKDILQMLKDIDKPWDELPHRLKYGELFYLRKMENFYSKEEMSKIPEQYRPEGSVYRSVIKVYSSESFKIDSDIQLSLDLDDKSIFRVVDFVYGNKS